MEVLEQMAHNRESKRQRYDKEDEELLDKVASEEITEKTLKECLTQHVEQVISQMKSIQGLLITDWFSIPWSKFNTS